MDLLPAALSHDEMSTHVRKFAASRLYELIAALQPFVAEALRDPLDLQDQEPARIQATVSVIKLYNSCVKQLGDLYQAGTKPADKRDAELLTPGQVELLLEQQRVELQRAADAAVAAAVESARRELVAAASVSLEDARVRVASRVAEYSLKRVAVAAAGVDS